MAAMEQQQGEKVWNWRQDAQVFGQAPATSFRLTLSAVLCPSICAPQALGINATASPLAKVHATIHVTHPFLTRYLPQGLATKLS
jgi:hypothetical protein